MEKLKDITLTRGESNNFNIAINLTGGGAGVTVWKDDSAGTVVKKLELLIENIKKGILDRALA